MVAVRRADILVVGAGAAGLMCALTAGRRGRKVHVIDHNAKPAEKIRISGGGRCNFTNIHTQASYYLSQNPRFCLSALARYTPGHFLEMVRAHGIAYHEKKLGQLFCNGSAQAIIDMLMRECAEAGVEIHLDTQVREVERRDGTFRLGTTVGKWEAEALVIASGGLSIPKMGASGWGYEVARMFGISIIPPSPGLAPFTLPETLLKQTAPLSGIAVEASVRCGKQRFDEGLLFTHRGLSGPSILQISSYWQEGQAITVDLYPVRELESVLRAAKEAHPRQEAVTILGEYLPKRLAGFVGERTGLADRRLADLSHSVLREAAKFMHGWQVVPGGTEGYRTAEVTKGGVDTRALSSQTMESVAVKGLYFIGEVVDMTGWLGGYNFQWAWASGNAAGMAA